MDVQRETSEGFARGTITVEGADAHRGKQLQIDFQNENLVAHMDGSIIACVPNLICCLESEGVRSAFCLITNVKGMLRQDAIVPSCTPSAEAFLS